MIGKNWKTLFAGLSALLIIFLAGPSAAQSGCFRHGSATVNGTINIRQSHSTTSAVVRVAVAGESFTVSSSTQGRAYCWLNIGEDWMAWTTRVTASQPGQTSTTPTQTTQAPDIDNCCFVDRQCQTDGDWTNGYWAYQRNECPVTAPDTQQTPAQPVASAPADVDNCCFVDRQCQTDGDWTNGYWAYQRNECPATAPGTSQTPAQPAASAPADVDNCCFMGWQCHTNQDWLNGYYAYQNGRCVAPAQSLVSVPATGGNCCDSVWECLFDQHRVQGYWAFQLNQCAGPPQTSAITLSGPVPRIEGSSRFVQHVTTTLKLIKSVAPDWYHYVITGMDVIVEVPVHLPPGYSDGESSFTCTATARARERRVTLESCWIDNSSRITGVIEHDQESTAAALGHEACHIHTHEEGKHFATLEDEEAECRKFGGGASVLVKSALAIGLDPSRGTSYFYIDNAISLLRRYCSEGYRADLFCPTVQRLQSKWRNVPYAVFPIDPPQF